jgi:hypothetical protein
VGAPGRYSATAAGPGLVAIGLAGVAASACAAALATWVPRHAVAAAMIGLLILVVPFSLLPTALRYVSVGFGVRAIAGYTDDGVVVGAIALTGITVVATALALWRIRRIE